MRLLAAALLLLPAAALARPDEPFAAKTEALDPPAALAEPVRTLLSKDALVVRSGDAVVMRVWFRDVIPVKATPEQLKNGITYREIPEGALVGAIEFPTAFTDFRKQELAAGVYTLRFAVQPDIGDHTGTAPHPDFCLLSPAGKDRSAEPMEVKDLIELSSTVNEGKHPAVLLLFPNFDKAAGPKVVGKGDGVWVATTRRAVAAGATKASLGFAVTVAGQWKQ
ncbi:hypothetical protein [Urbifossiella limnaea]|uniref:DUF4198 domain-containing protein n=1 Tax=Urbifossiella limnaea TaxID=2528023 RepID=A0A517XZN0_9BACT|nr:hypothetical protein [Urbifossiella limnaea]QDU22918.1 hypothetical protein ETAA1_49070 [Urbifossiella limnaea]